MDQPNKPSILITSSSKKPQQILIVAGIIALIFVVAMSVWYLRSIRSKDLPNKTIVSSPSPTSISKPSEQSVNKVFQFNKCNTLQANSNPLIGGDLSVIEQGKDTLISGVFIGNINSISYNKTTKTAKIEFISSAGMQTYTTDIKEEPQLVYNSVTKKDSSLSELKVGNSIVASFNCFPKQNDLFKIVTIEVNGNIY
ncbi:hypothetical protein A2631_03820 [Candidatus Daviesbacteria bacterium RIFCSPHIGHO2_01_FULL_44_29]|uniref:DUF5666 domain-containing protein n=1 Tax=Candidatus Daviesbacteria bacterium RIFCSPHIGHO2_02_FULL_43_12 TaxID=1797776 RepID=A0A1F5KHS0_9BACT|nr:MAG: hypothetical protein A2631_03820 [Candidatus Daviesbacteria bacterium RIFCSPHIGHO2_01_FULL_44_29]OGE39801.1 MAG: hypothetical protein A3E86_04485 [Candidatus Daviesbacteria bacterium RIFCSPHIGHO2_12_FULL_47_45]OGE40486.1 MAG: hypothetical protein A3D25_00280 [Candidatus Daviesbacteria bacterium RIFCSPHIGHO2_02_FULL_43_12]OGE70037.1 MAG: hypothetical protein A3B55_05080 [Candidatus Daviesbacteria bacterium RIFCSPLOWO2_01_FULL_43_15]